MKGPVGDNSARRPGRGLRLSTGLWLTVVGAMLLLSGCGEDDAGEPSRSSQGDLSLDVDTVLTDTSYALVNHDSSTVTVPDAFLGTPVLLGAIYTECPNVCPQITANMKRVREQVDAPDSVRFVSVTFDPLRDRPARLRTYRADFDLEDTSWQFLTGDPAPIASFLGTLGVRWNVQGTDRTVPADTSDEYVFRHSNQITLIDAQGRVRAEYGGSQTPPSLIARDLEKIRR